MCESAAKRLRLDEIGERPPAVDLDDREPLAITALELWVAGDVDGAKIEGKLGAHSLQHAERGPAEVALGRVVENDAPRRYG